MRFISIRDLRLRSGEVWKQLETEGDLVVTSHGKPVAVMTDADEGSLEDTLAALRQARARAAVAALRKEAVKRGLDRITPDRVNEIVGAYRAARRKGRR